MSVALPCAQRVRIGLFELPVRPPHGSASAIVGCEKPDRRIFEQALRQSGARPEQTLHVGDLYHADVTGRRTKRLDERQALACRG
jgi:ribonucleotide monophosphatase NagD (HAD superfamily)